MTAYTFFFNEKTFTDRTGNTTPGENVGIEYVTGKNKFPLNSIKDGDELFCIGLDSKRVLIAGRLVVDGTHMSRTQADVRLGKEPLKAGDKPLRNGEIYLLGKPDLIDSFRTDKELAPEIVKELDLYNRKGRAKLDNLRIGNPTVSLLRNTLRLSDLSASAIRNALGLLPWAAQPVTSQDDSKPAEFDDGLEAIPPGHDDDEYRLRSIKTRRGQSKFRERLMSAYGSQCVITGCSIEGLLEAAHITPHAEHTDYDVRNGLLLRSDIHTLLDLNLIGIDDTYRVRVSPRLCNTEYWIYDGQQMNRFPTHLADNPSREALRQRIAQLRVV